jgi:hypothetical protein
MGKVDRKSRYQILFGIGKTEGVLFSKNTASHSIDQTPRFCSAVSLGQFHPFVDGGVAGNLGEEKELVESEAEKVP